MKDEEVKVNEEKIREVKNSIMGMKIVNEFKYLGLNLTFTKEGIVTNVKT